MKNTFAKKRFPLIVIVLSLFLAMTLVLLLPKGIEVFAQAGDDFTAENWETIKTIVENGKTTINAADSKDAVDVAKTETMSEIDGVGKEVDMKAFYTLQEAYDNGWLTVEDLEKIASYNNDDSLPVYPEKLSDETIEQIKRYFEHFDNCMNKEHDVQIIYYGTYNEYVAVLIHCEIAYTGILFGEIVAGVQFHYCSPESILIYKLN
ncbi:MAG: hypothetical protein WC292_03830 [Clostridia bacterium]